MTQEAPGDDQLRFGGGRVLIDLRSRQLIVEGTPARLGGRAFDLLAALATRRDRVVPKQELLDLVWPGLVVEENNLQVHVMALRRLLGSDAIATVSGRGYRFTLAPALGAVAAPALPTARPPAAEAAWLFGRESLLPAIDEHLRDPACRLLTLTGPGGSGKTRLALRAAAAVAPRHAAGATVVMLAPLRDGAHVMSAVAAALGLQQSGGAPLAELVLAFVRTRELLLVLDNCEHLPGLPALLMPLLEAAPGLKLLATSRVRLRMADERVVEVPPLALPADTTAEAARASPAVQLLLQRAAAQGVTIGTRDEELRAAVDICRRLDGLPLAIELAAARLRLLTPGVLAQRLVQRLPLLKGGAADAPLRQQTLRDTIAWSVDLLPEPAQRLLGRLAVFSGGWSLEAAEALAATPAEREATLDALEALLDHHLVQRVDDLAGEPRYAMLETIREYALGALDAAGEGAAVRARHAAHNLALAEALAPQLASADRAGALQRGRAELNNLRLALGWLIHDQPEPDAALRLAAALAWLWYFAGLYAEGRAWMAQARALPGTEQPGPPLAALLSGEARLAMYGGEPAVALTLLERSVPMWRALGDPRGLAFARIHEGIAAIIGTDAPRARAALQEALELFRGLADPWGIALACSYLGTAYVSPPGTEAEARALLLEGRARFRALGDDWGMTVSSHYLGSLALRLGDHDSARELTLEMLASSTALGDRYRIARNHHQLAEIDLAQGRLAEACGQLAESLAINVEQNRIGDAAQQLRLLTRLADEQGRPADALRLAALAARHAGEGGTMLADDPAAHAARVETLRARLGETDSQAAEAAAAAMTLADAVALARQLAAGAAP